MHSQREIVHVEIERLVPKFNKTITLTDKKSQVPGD